MEYRKEFDVRTFGFWGGAEDWFKAFARRDKLDELQANVESVFDGMVPTATQVNDFVWFDDELHKLVEDEDKDGNEEDDNDGL